MLIRSEPCWPGPPQLAVRERVGSGQRRFKSLCECGPSQADGHACSIHTKMEWSEHESLYLIEFWGKDSIQVKIEGCARNREVYVKFAEQMKEAVYSRTSLGLPDPCSADSKSSPYTGLGGRGFSRAGVLCTNDIASVRTKEHAYYSGWLAFLYSSCEQKMARFTSSGCLGRLGSARQLCSCEWGISIMQCLINTTNFSFNETPHCCKSNIYNYSQGKTSS